MIELTKGQQQAKDELLDTIKNRTHRFHTLKGGAGFGKSTLIVDVLRSIPSHMKVGFAAPTHAAVNVLQDMLTKENLLHRVQCRTIHSVLGLKPKWVKHKEYFVKDPKAKEHIFDVLLIDESSMLDDDMLGYIIECGSGTVIFIGDDYQISPVDSEVGEVSKCFTEVDMVSKLTEVVRCAKDNPIIMLATELREAQDDPYAGIPCIRTEIKPDGSGVYVLNKKQFEAELFKHINTDEFLNDYNHVRCVGYTNKQVDEVNANIRKQLHSEDVTDFVKGEMVVSQESKSDSYTVDYNNAEVLEVVDFEDDVCYNHCVNGLPYTDLKLRAFDGKIVRVKVLKSNAISAYNHLCQSLIDKANANKNTASMIWRKFYELKKDFNFFKPIYACTAHKSQGSTFDYTFVYLPDFTQYGITKEIKELIYTATTRSRYRTYFLLGE
jgi:exodeoxyribonuclease V